MKTNKFISIFGVVLSALFVLACGGEMTVETETDPTVLERVEGGKFKGGVLHLNSIEDYTSLFPPSVNDIYSTHIASQGYEGLLKLDQKTLEVQPCIAQSFDIDKSKKIYTFHLRNGIKFSDDECFEGGIGREIIAADFKYCFEFLCSNHKENKWQSLFRNRVLGAADYAEGKSKTVEGIQVIDNSTLVIELIEPYAGFPNLLTISATSVYPKEAIEKYGYEQMHHKIVGSGPFIAKTIKNGENVTFVRNNTYWRTDDFGNKLPFLSQVEFSFIKDKNAELKAFQSGELDMVWGIPNEEIPNVMGSLEEAKDGKNKEFEVQSINSLNIQYYGFLQLSDVFKDVLVRKAFNYAIDRDSLVDFVLQGEGQAAHNGFVPEMKGYPHKSVTGFDYNPELARELIKEAGYPNGKGFPEITLNLNASGGINEKVANTLTAMLNKNLGINIALNVIPMAELHPMVEAAQVDFWRSGWIADYPDPSNFLYLFHGKNIIEGQETSINYFRYASAAFDEVYEAALREIDTEKRMALYAQADQILMDDAVIMPLYFNLDIRLIDPDLKDFDVNEMEYRDLSVVYFKKSNKDNVRVYENLSAEDE